MLNIDKGWSAFRSTKGRLQEREVVASKNQRDSYKWNVIGDFKMLLIASKRGIDESFMFSLFMRYQG